MAREKRPVSTLCAACKLVKYCSRECQIAHRPQHKRECKKRANELHDEKLFKQPPPDEDCPICMIRLPTLPKGRVYMACCGKLVCGGCTHAPVYDDKGNRVDDDKQNECPFCRTVAPKSYEKTIKRLEKRIELNDPTAIHNMGVYYSHGQFGLSQNDAKALELWHRAGELGHHKSYFNIGGVYNEGRGVEIDKQKALHYWELAAMGGDVEARHNLGAMEGQAGNMDRALKHFMIAVKDGGSISLESIKRMHEAGLSTKDEYTKALQLYQEYLDEVKSDQRDQAAAADDANKYY